MVINIQSSFKITSSIKLNIATSFIVKIVFIATILINSMLVVGEKVRKYISQPLNPRIDGKRFLLFTFLTLSLVSLKIYFSYI